MATFVLVHGGGHGGWCYQPLAERLARNGHRTYAPTLTGLADRAHLLRDDVGLRTHITDVAKLIEYEDLSSVILVGHSYGGMVITGAADLVPDRIGHLVYLDAAIPENGEALVDVSPGLLQLKSANRVVDGIELALWPEGPVLDVYGLAGCRLEQWALQRLTPHPWRSFVEPLVLACPERVAAIPRTIINCTRTLAVRPEETRSRWLSAMNVWEIDTGHDLMLIEPETVAGMLERLA